MHTKVFRGLSIRHASLFDQPHSLKLELACKLPSLHDTPPVPSKHLTRCPRNRVQAKKSLSDFGMMSWMNRASVSPFLAARAYHFAASEKSCDTPRPLRYIKPRLF